MANPGQQQCATCGAYNNKGTLSCWNCKRMLDEVALPQPSPIRQQSPAVSPSPGGNMPPTSWQIPPAPGRAGPVPRRGGSSLPRMWSRPGFRPSMPRLPHNLPQFRLKASTIFILLLIVFLVIMSVGAHFLYERLQRGSATPTPVVTPVVVPKLPDGLGVIQFSKEQYIGVNDGSFPAFDV